jgi:hypothetical protein
MRWKRSNKRALRGGDARPVVDDGEHRTVAGAPHRHLDLAAGRRVAYGVVEQVAQQQAKQHGIPRHRHLPVLRLDRRQADLDALRGGSRRDLCNALPRQRLPPMAASPYPSD